ncbi:hypothetical protein AB0H36_02255 [Kribbella sp. NPDC050820]
MPTRSEWLRPSERFRLSPAFVQSTRRRFYRLRSTIFRLIWPVN